MLCLQVFSEMGDFLVKTAVLLAAYNGIKNLPALLESLEAQTDSDFSVLMQDDGSEDGTQQLLESWREKDSRFVFGGFQGRHFGPAGNFLSLLRQTDADYALLCDQEDLWAPDKIGTLKHAIMDAASVYGPQTPLLVHSDCSLIDEKGSIIADSFFRHQGWDPAALSLNRLLVQNNVTGCTLIMNRPLIDLVSAYGKAKELFMHDWFIALTAASFGRILFLPQPLTFYRQHGDNAVGASRKGLARRGLQALSRRKDARRRILLTYTHTMVFRKLYKEKLPPEADRITSEYLATRQMPKIRRMVAVRRLGCTMQSPVTRMGQLLFG